MLKYASSAAHIAGKAPTPHPETFTWLTEHFRTLTFPSAKPDMDLMFVSGVNHMFFHGTPHSSKESQMAGMEVHASIDMFPLTFGRMFCFEIYHPLPVFSCKWGNRTMIFLVYLPVYDMW